MDNKYCRLKNSKLVWKIDKIIDNNVYLSMDNKKLKTNINNILIIDNYTPDINYNIKVDLNNIDVSSEIMLRHKTKLEAIQELDKFIDKAVCANIPRVKIIHGKNGGIIRKAVHEYLDNSPYISSYHLGDFHEGSFGVTIAYLTKI